MNPLLLLALGLGAAYVLWPKARYLGDKAVVGDDVFVPIAPGGAGFPGLPAEAGQVVVRVTDAQKDVLTGPVVGYALAGAPAVGYASITVPPGTPPASVNRSAVTAIRRGDKLVS